MYSTGMPLLYPFACIFYFVLYWVYKFLLLKYYERTNRFNEELPIMTTQYIKVGLILHGAFGGLMITNSRLIPPDMATIKERSVDLTQDNIFDLLIGRFFRSEYSLIYTFFWIGVLAWLLAKDTILEYVYRFFACLARLCVKEKEENDYAHSRDFFKDIKVKPLTDLYDKAKDEFEDYKDFNPSDYDMFRFEEEPRFTVDSTKEKLQTRVEQIVKVIDDHLIFLHGQHNMHFFEYTQEIDGESKKVAIPPMEKLAYLFQQQLYFDCKDVAHHKRLDTLRMRMQTITQSYHMLDSALYAKMKPIKEILEDNPKW